MQTDWAANVCNECGMMCLWTALNDDSQHRSHVHVHCCCITVRQQQERMVSIYIASDLLLMLGQLVKNGICPPYIWHVLLFLDTALPASHHAWRPQLNASLHATVSLQHIWACTTESARYQLADQRPKSHNYLTHFRWECLHAQESETTGVPRIWAANQSALHCTPQCLLLLLSDANHEVSHEGVVHAAVGCHISLH